MGGLMIIEQSGQRVLTTAQLAINFETTSQVINNNYTRNRDRYILGKHYFLLEGQQLRDFRATNQIDVPPNVNKLYLWSERGAWLHAKSLNTDKAWDAYRGLVDDYYAVKEQVQVSAALSKDQALVTVLRTTADLYEGQREIREMVTEHETELKEIRVMVEEQITLNYGEQRALQKAIARKVYEFEADPDARRDLFSQLHREIKDRWAVASYKDVRRSELAFVLKYVDAWRPVLAVAL